MKKCQLRNINFISLRGQGLECDTGCGRHKTGSHFIPGFSRHACVSNEGCLIVNCVLPSLAKATEGKI